MHIGVYQPSTSAAIAATAAALNASSFAVVAAANASIMAEESYSSQTNAFKNNQQHHNHLNHHLNHHQHHPHLHPFCSDPLSYPLSKLHKDLSHLLPRANQNESQHANNNHQHYHSYTKTYETKSNHNWRVNKCSRTKVSIKPKSSCDRTVPTLLDMSSKVVAENIPFKLIEQKYQHIPEPVQRRIIYWSFPSNEEDIKMYSAFSTDHPSLYMQSGSTIPTSSNPAELNSANATSNSSHPPSNPESMWLRHIPAKNQQQRPITFSKGAQLCTEGCVSNVLQVGFSLSGLVNINNNVTKIVSNQNQQPSTNDLNTSSYSNSSNHCHQKSFRVSVEFDRCKITSVSCSCDFQDIFWCEHVIALILYRIRNPETIDLRIPISETLLSLDRQQLQKLVQYLISEHRTEVLPTAQRLLDEITQSSTSAINQFPGAPDPTAGSEDLNLLWHLDEQQVCEKIKSSLELIQCGSYYKEGFKTISALFEKIKEMIGTSDRNGARLLKIITEQFLSHATRNDKFRPLWDLLVSTWVVIMADPDITDKRRQKLSFQLMVWSKAVKCPKEDMELRTTFKRRALEVFNPHQHYLSDLSGSRSNSALHQSNFHPSSASQFLPSNNSISVPIMRPFNQISALTSSCSCHQSGTNYPPASKKIRCHQSGNQYHSGNNQRNSSASSSSNQLNHNQRPNHVAQPLNENRPSTNRVHEPRGVFHRAVDLKDITWDDHHLQFILNNDNPVDPNTCSKSNLFDFKGHPLWDESLSLAATRVLTLQSYGYVKQALRLAMATIRRLKLIQDQWRLCMTNNSCMSFCLSNDLAYNEPWLGHPFDPANVLFDILLEASSSASHDSSPYPRNHVGRCSCPYSEGFNNFAPGSIEASLLSLAPLTYNQSNNKTDMMRVIQSRLSLKHVAFPPVLNMSSYHNAALSNCCQRDPYITMAVELAAMALGQQRSVPSTQTAQERVTRQESELISKLENIDIVSDPILIEILRNQATIILDGGPFMNQCCVQPTDSSPIHSFAKFLFTSLVSHHPNLAFKIGTYALKMPLNYEDNSDNHVSSRNRSSNYLHFQAEQLSLAQVMLSRAREDQPSKEKDGFLKKICKASTKNIRNASNLLKLARHALKEAKPAQNQVSSSLLKIAYDLGQQVLKATVNPHNSNVKTRRDAILFIVECVTEFDYKYAIELMKHWRIYFSPIEAIGLIVGTNNETNLKCQLLPKLNKVGESEVNSTFRSMVLECASNDPSNCALDALKFCENHKESLDKALNIVVDAGKAGSMDSSQLIKVSEHVHERGSNDRAFEIALVAVEGLHIPSNVENSAAKKDIMRACEFAREVSGFCLLIPILIKNIECAAVLSEIYHTFKPSDNYAFLQAPLYTGGTATNANFQEFQKRHIDAYWWDMLLKTAIAAFETTTRSRLINISPRHYGEFIDFLVKAQMTYDKAADGPNQFGNLIFDIMKSYKTTKKRMERLKDKFDYQIAEHEKRLKYSPVMG